MLWIGKVNRKGPVLVVCVYYICWLFSEHDAINVVQSADAYV